MTFTHLQRAAIIDLLRNDPASTLPTEEVDRLCHDFEFGQELAVMSPDGFPIHAEPYHNLDQLAAGVAAWILRYADQGYYSDSRRNRIPLEEIPSYLKVTALPWEPEDDDDNEDEDEKPSLTVPPDPEGKNEDRAEWAQDALEAFAAATHMDTAGEDDQTIMTDLLCNLRHYADRNGIDFRQCLRIANVHYQEETTA